MPKSSSSTGISIADSTPPALKSSHRNGSGWRLIIQAPLRSQATNADTTAQPT